MRQNVRCKYLQRTFSLLNLEAIIIESQLFWLGVIGLGAAHAFEPDHMAAVSTFVAGRPTPREAAGFGCKWALGHGFSLLLLGGALAALKMLVHQPALFASGVLDKIVGLVLLGLGLWMMIQLRTGPYLPRTWAGWRAVLRGRAWRERTLEEQIVEQQANARHAQNVDEEEPLPLFGAPNASATRATLSPAQSARVVTRVAKPEGKKAGLASLWMGMLHGAAGTGAFVGQAAITLSQSWVIALLYTVLFSLGVLMAMSFYAAVLGGALTYGQARSASWLRTARWLTAGATCAIGICLVLGVEF